MGTLAAVRLEAPKLSWNEIERIWQLKRPLGVQTDQVAVLVADIGDDVFPELLDLDALVGLVDGDGWLDRTRRVLGTQKQVMVVDVLEPTLLQVSQRPISGRPQERGGALVKFGTYLLG